MSDERGTTLVELLVAMAVGMVVLFAIFTTVEVARRSQATTSARVEALQRGRAGMEQTTRLLRSAACPDNAVQTAFTEAETTRVGFHSKLGPDPTVIETALVRKRVLRLEGGALWEDVYRPAPGVVPGGQLSYDETDPDSRILIERVRPVGTTPVFTYLSGPAAVIADPAQRLKARAVRVELLVLPRQGDARLGAPFRSTVALRTDDITDLDQVPEC